MAFYYFFIGSNMSEKRTIDDVVKKDKEYWTAVMDDVLIEIGRASCRERV